VGTIEVLTPPLTFTRYFVTSKLYCGSPSSFCCPPPSAKPTLLQYYCTPIAQYTPPPPILPFFAIHHMLLVVAVSCKGQAPAPSPPGLTPFYFSGYPDISIYIRIFNLHSYMCILVCSRVPPTLMFCSRIPPALPSNLRRGFYRKYSTIISPLGSRAIWGQIQFYLRVRSLPGINLKPRFGPNLDSTA